MAVSIGVALSQILSFIDVVLFVTQSHDENECKFNCCMHFLSCMRVTYRDHDFVIFVFF